MMKLGHQEPVEEVEAQLEEKEMYWTKGSKDMEDEEDLEEVEELEEAQTTLREMSLSQKLRLTPTR